MKIHYLILILFLLLVPFTTAITGSIGNAKAIVTITLDGSSKTISRDILVQNVNDEVVNIKLEALDDLEDIVNIIDPEFSLQPGEEKKARYQITVNKLGIYQGQIVVFFEPSSPNSPGVALPSSLTLKVQDKDGNTPGLVKDDPVEDPEEDDTPDDTIDVDDNEVTGGVTIGVGGDTRLPEEKSPNYVMFSFLGLLGLVVIAVVVYFIKKL